MRALVRKSVSKEKERDCVQIVKDRERENTVVQRKIEDLIKRERKI